VGTEERSRSGCRGPSWPARRCPVAVWAWGCRWCQRVRGRSRPP